MRAPRCTLDSSCLIALDHLNLISQLSFVFSNVLVPKGVREEVFKRRGTKDRVQLLFNTYNFFQRRDAYDRGTISFLLAERSRLGMRDRGEVEAVVQASEVGATVLVDDSWGRQLAERYALESHGTLWTLQRFYGLALLSAVELRDCFVSLKLRAIRLPWETVDEFLLTIGQTQYGNCQRQD